MHASTEHLLNLRDGLPVSSEVSAHVRNCSECLREVEHLRALQKRLCHLPQVEPPAGVWNRVTRAGMSSMRTEASYTWFYPAVGFAASALLVVSAIVWFSRTPSIGVQPTVPSDPMITELMQESQRLESTLRELPFRPALTDARTARTIAALEDQLALIDHGLSYGGELTLTRTQHEKLWQERVDLMNSLVSVRYAQAQRVSYSEGR